MSFVVYKSSAGSGKTSTLVTEFLTLALSSDPNSGFRHTLAITFTNKAAHEMKERVLQALKNFASPKIEDDLHIADAICQKLKIDRAELGTRSKFLLTDLIHHYADLSISTIDSFVSRLVHQFAYDLNLPFQFRVELDNNELLEQAVDELLDETGKENQSLTKILTQFILHQTENEKSRRIESELLLIGNSLLKNELKPVFESLQPITEEEYLSFRKNVQKRLKLFENRCFQIGKECVDFLKERGIEINDFKGGKTSSLAKSFEFLQIPEKVRDNPFNKAAIGFIEGNDWTGKKPKNSIAQHQSEIEAFILPKLKSLYSEYQHYVMLQLLGENVYHQATINLLSQTFERIKDEKNVVSLSSFNDLVHKLVTTESAPFIYERIGERYHHYMVDEFQDTSTIQWANLTPLYTNSLASNYLNMVVGDAKQSIYRWRGGDSEQFISLGTAPKDYLNEIEREHLSTLSREFKEDVLDTNHRSFKEIVEFNNQFFRKASELLSDNGKSVYAQVKQKVNPNKVGGKVSIQLKPSKEDEKTWQRERIENLLKEIHEGEQFSLADICVLCRKNSELKTVAKWIEEAGFEVFTFESLTLERSKSIQLIRSVLQWYIDTENPSYAIEVVVKLMELNLIDSSISIHETFKTLTLSPSSLRHWLKEQLSIELPERYSDELSLYTFYQAICLALPLTYDAYLSTLSNFILTYAEQQGENLSNFLNYFDQKKGKISIQSHPSETAVQLMTIHKSKGLQFPIVVMPFTNLTEHPKQDPKWVSNELTELTELPHSLVSMSKKVLDTKLSAVYNEEIKRQELDILNMLYVGFTRPKYQLYAFIDPWVKNAKATKFLELLEEFDEFDSQSRSLTFGDGAANNITAINKLERQYPKFQRSHWKNRIHLSTSRLRLLDAQDQEEQLLGQHFHGYMQLVNSRFNLSVANRWLKKQPIAESVKSLIIQSAHNVISHPTLSNFFDKGCNNWRETNLLSNGQVLRADRIVETDDQLIIIDYKTAKPNYKHIDQIRKYGYVLHQLNTKKIQLLLVYLFPQLKVEEVSLQLDLFS